MRILIGIALLSLSSISSCSPANHPQEQHEKRQGGDYSALLALASQAGISIPTDNPALLLSIAPVAASLNSLLPTAPVLSALETAAPTGLISSLVNDPSFAASWISSFYQGPSPSWFLALPTSVRSYLNTYASGGNLGAIATAAAGIQSIQQSVGSQLSASSRSSAISVNASSVASSITGSRSTSSGTTGLVGGVTSGGSLSTSLASITSAVASTLSTAGAAKESGVLAAGAIAMAGILGLAVAL